MRKNLIWVYTLIILLVLSCKIEQEIKKDHEVLMIELNQYLELRADALINKNVDFFNETLHDNFLYTNSSGNTLNKQEYINNYLLSKKFNWKNQEMQDKKIMVHGNFFIIKCIIHDVFDYEDYQFDVNFKSTQVFKNEDDKWIYLVGHTSNLNE